MAQRAEVELALGQRDAAIAIAVEMEALAAEPTLHAVRAGARELRGRLARDVGELEAARELFLAAEEDLVRDGGEKARLAVLRLALGEVLVALGSHGEAAAKFELAKEAFLDLGLPEEARRAGRQARSPHGAEE